MNSYYKILGVERNASEEDIKKAYKSKVIEFHPDVNKSPGSEEDFKKIANAYEVLSDKQKRMDYDYSLLIGGPFAGGSTSVDELTYGIASIFAEMNRVAEEFRSRVSVNKDASRPSKGNIKKERAKSKKKKNGCVHCFGGFVEMKQGNVVMQVPCKYC